jgi:hypothetical protein
VSDINEPDDLLGMLPDEIIAALDAARAENTALREALRLMYYGSDTVSQREIQERARALLATREGKG